MSELDARIKEFAAIAGSLPENLQQVCFELLLRNHLGLTASTAQSTPTAPQVDQTEVTDAPGAESRPSQDDLSEPDLHAKARRFLHQNGLNIDHINNLYYKEGDQILTLYEDLKTTQMADGQIRIALLRALTAALSSGTFEADLEEVRAEAGARKVYDAANFTRNFKKNKDLFDFDKWDRSIKKLRLSAAGRTRLAEVIRELQ